MQKEVIEIMINVFELDPNKLPQKFEQNEIENWDSLRHLNFIIELEEKFNLSFEPEEISEMISLDEIIKFINSKVN